MRVALLSDVHANLHALDAVLGALAAERVDAVACAGDLVGYGPEPDACVARVLAVASTCVAGNHDLIVLGRLDTARCIPLARDSLAWTAARIGAPTRAALAALPLQAVAPGGLVVTHGAPGDPQRYVTGAGEARRALAQLDAGRRMLVVGHTHEPLAVGERRGTVLHGRAGTVTLGSGERWLLNPGSVGQSRDRRPLARFAVVDLEQGTATFRAVPYATDACRAALVAYGLPARSCHQPRTLPRRARALAGRARRRLTTRR